MNTRLQAIGAAAALACATLLGASGCAQTLAGTPIADLFVPNVDNPDPSEAINGVTKIVYPTALHVGSDQRVAYTHSPPFGGRHDGAWAKCTGVVYPQAIRTETAVHSLEHGAVWITYNPDLISDDDVELLAERVTGIGYMLMSPYPTLDAPISLQSWGHQLKLDDAEDSRIDQFISALRLNPAAFPEVGATCAVSPLSFDADSPPPFDPTTPDPLSPDTVPE